MTEWYPISTAPRDGSRIRVRGLFWGVPEAGYWYYDAEFRDGEFYDVNDPSAHFNPEDEELIIDQVIQWTYIRIAEPD